jgi:hypothetical protein
MGKSVSWMLSKRLGDRLGPRLSVTLGMTLWPRQNSWALHSAPFRPPRLWMIGVELGALHRALLGALLGEEVAVVRGRGSSSRTWILCALLGEEVAVVRGEHLGELQGEDLGDVDGVLPGALPGEELRFVCMWRRTGRLAWNSIWAERRTGIWSIASRGSAGRKGGRRGTMAWQSVWYWEKQSVRNSVTCMGCDLGSLHAGNEGEGLVTSWATDYSGRRGLGVWKRPRARYVTCRVVGKLLGGTPRDALELGEPLGDELVNGLGPKVGEMLGAVLETILGGELRPPDGHCSWGSS